VTLTPHPLLVPWSRKSRAIPLLLLGGEKCEGKWFEIGSYKKTYNNIQHKKNHVVSLEATCFVSNLKHAQHISFGCAPREFYFSFLKGNIY
jgi:hypothetical protein